MDTETYHEEQEDIIWTKDERLRVLCEMLHDLSPEEAIDLFHVSMTQYRRDLALVRAYNLVKAAIGGTEIP